MGGQEALSSSSQPATRSEVASEAANAWLSPSGTLSTGSSPSEVRRPLDPSTIAGTGEGDVGCDGDGDSDCEEPSAGDAVDGVRPPNPANPGITASNAIATTTAQAA